MFPRTGTLLSAGCLGLLLGSCATENGKAPTGGPKAPMDFAVDTGGGRMFYRGTAFIPRGFNSREVFDLDVQLSRWGNPPANEASRSAGSVLTGTFTGKGRYQPLGNGEGEIQLARGRFQLRGVILDDGQELDGEWFLDGRYGGGFRMTRKGHLFPSSH